MNYLLIGVLALVGALLILSWIEKIPPSLIRKIFYIVAAIAIIFLLIRGKAVIAGIFAAIVAMIPVFLRLTQLISSIKFFRGLFQQGKSNMNAGSGGKMTKAQAREILGVSEHATPEEIKKAYQNLMKKHHPDSGGTEYFAKLLNDAKDTLLK